MVLKLDYSKNEVKLAGNFYRILNLTKVKANQKVSLTLILQAPFCCMFLDFVASFANMVEARPPWQKTALYVV